MRLVYRVFFQAAVVSGVAFAPPETGAGQPPGPDANALVKKMVAAYKSADTFQENSEAVIRNSETEMIQTTRFTFQKPTRFTILTQDPRLGTMRSHSDGKSVTLYLGRTNLYARRKAGADLRTTLRAHDKAMLTAFGTAIYYVLHPFSLMTAGAMPREARQFRYAGAAQVNGVRTHKVTAQADTAWLREVIPVPKAEFTRRDIALWLDTRTNTLAKSSVLVEWRAPRNPKDKKPVFGRGVLSLVQTNRDVRINAPVDEGEFRFVPPKNAKEVFRESAAR